MYRYAIGLLLSPRLATSAIIFTESASFLPA